MKELMIDNELRDLLPPLTEDERTQLEKSLKDKGYVGSPIYTWNGYIVDGHNRYEICNKYNIEFKCEKLWQDESGFTKVDVIEWMINTQLGRRNLTLAQKMIVGQKYKDKIREEAKEKQGNRNDLISQTFSPNGEEVAVNKVHTDKELAKMLGVGAGTIGRWNQIEKHADEELKKKVVSGEVTIGKAYDIVKESKPTKEKEESSQKENVKEVKNNEVSQEIKDIIANLKTPKKAEDYWNFLNEIECIEDDFKEPIRVVNNVLFERHNIDGNITQEEKDIAIECMKEIRNEIDKIINKLKNVNVKGDN